ncbi:MAG: RHS repeat-associated core domain-containing protein [Kiritimatiellae bacterium]|nr:RHS repeat-associated core domain-containing protein [Kiritimatiellia bacterium]
MKINSMLFILTVVSITSLGHSRCMLERGDLFDRFHFRHATKYYDPETGLYYYGERYYSPELGRWINRDPIEEEGGINIFEFVNNNPINRVDRLGLFPLTYDLEIELDYKRVPIRVGKGGGITYANTWARGPDITQIKDAEIVKTGKCCAKIKYAPKYKIIIHAHWLSENEIGRSATESGYDAIIGHEQKRGGGP